MKIVFRLFLPALFFYLFPLFPLSGQWITQASKFKTPNQFPFTICAVDKNIVWAASVDAIETFKAPSLEYTKTIDGGKNWVSGKVSDLATLRSNCIVAVDENTAWNAMNDVTQGGDGGIFKTSNGGMTWTKQSTAFPGKGAYISFVHFFDRNHGLTVGDPRGTNNFEIYVTSNGGTNWIPIAHNGIPETLPDEEVFDRCYSVIGNTVWFGTLKGRVFKSTDRGVTWSVSVAAMDLSHIHGLSFRDENNGMAVYSYKTFIGKTSDGGRTWSTVPAPSKPSTAYITHVPGTSGAYVITAPLGFGFTPGSAYTLDDGNTWNEVDSIPHQRATFLSPTVGWSGGINSDSVTGGMYKWSGNVFGKKRK